ncbi:hypothetical protein FSST1_003380 [Fusarium sambucinum]
MLRTLVLASLAILSSGYPRVVSDEDDNVIGLFHINEARRAEGLNDLTWDESLGKSAKSWADKMADGKVSFNYRPARYPISGQAIYMEDTATDCVGQSFEATLQSAVGSWLRKETNTDDYDACMKPAAEYVGCGKSKKTFDVDGGKKCTFYDVCFFSYGCWPPLSPPPQPTQKNPGIHHHWGYPIYIPTPVKFTPIKGSDDEAKLEFSEEEE